MSNTIKGSESGGTFTPVPAGTHIARCVRVIDLGTQMVGVYEKPGVMEPKEQIILTFELPSKKIIDKDGDEMPMLIFKTYTKSMHEKASLRLHLEAWRAAKYTAEQLKAFDANKLCGRDCLITVENTTDGDKTYSKVTAVTGLPDGVTCPPAVHTPFTYEIEEADGGHFSDLPEWIQKKIIVAAEFKPKNSTSDNGAPPAAVIDEVIKNDPPF